MFDYRYHALSLAAVLFALAVGILIGVAISDSSLVSSAQTGIARNLRSELGESQRNLEQVSDQLGEKEALIEDLYSFAVHGVLAERSIGLLFLGESSNQIDSTVRDAISEAGGKVTEVLAVGEPLDLAALARQATGRRYTALASDPSLVKGFGVRIGKELIGGGQLLKHVHTTLFSSYDGELGRLAGLVVVRSEPSGMNAQASKTTSEFNSGLIAGVRSEGVPAVGVELTTTEPSEIPWYKGENLASVDDLDTFAGRTAVALALAGQHGEHGAYGVKQTADALLPSVRSVYGEH